MFLSTENPPNDPSSSSNFLHLTSSCDELGQSHHNNLHLPNFSIRDYVCSYRSKDIKNNWPFSPKSLQLCLRHGINDPLPPLQLLGAVGNHCGNICRPSDSHSLAKQITPSVEQIIPSCVSDKSKLDTLTNTIKGVEISGLSQSVVENDLLPILSVSKSEIKITMNKNPGKKCGLLLKSGACVNRGSKEDNSLASSESMAPKTCPICKTFSSASNTTLNAHIDQCLSADAALPTAKPNRHRIKPRRVRTMTDIYATAKGCTLEELDRRNGTTWAMISNYYNRSADKPEVFRKGKKRKVLPARLDEDANGVGPVYVDSRGKKLRILSEFRENSSSPMREHKDICLRNKSSKEGNGGTWNSTRKKGRRAKKHHKYLRLFPQSKKLPSQKSNASEKPEYQEGYSGERNGTERTQTPKQLKPGQPRILNQRMLARRTGLSRKLNMKGHKFHASPDQPFENEDWSGDPILLRSPTHKFTDMSTSVSSCLNKAKTWRTCGESELVNKNETLFQRKSGQSLAFRVRITENKERSLVTVQQDTDHSKKNPASIQDRYSAGKVVSKDATRYLNEFPGASCVRKLSQEFPAKASRFLTSVDKLSISQAKSFRKLKKARFHLIENEDETGKWESEMAQDRALMVDDSDSGKTDEVLMSPNSSVSGEDDYEDEESSEEDATREEDVLDKTDDADAEFYQSDTPPSIDICNGSTSPGDQGRLYDYEEVGDFVYGQSVHEGAEPDSRVGQGSSFMEVDPISIPGPPGSFLPSPRDMGSDDYPGNSSIITSQVQSSQDLLDLTYKNSSESPLSAVSTHSGSMAARSTHVNLPAEFSSAQDTITSDYPTSYSVVPLDSAASSQQANADAEWTSDTGNFTLRSIIHDKRSFPYRSNDQPCCCQRKERFAEDFALNHQESQLLKRRAASSITIPEIRTPSRVDPNIMPSNSDTFLDTLEPYILQDSDLQGKFPNSMNRAVASPSNPVLRLMGKDLMVVNRGEEAPAPAPQFLDPSVSSESSIQTLHNATLHHSSSHHLRSPCAGTSAYSGTGLYSGNNANSATPQPQTPAEASAADAFRYSFGLVRYFSPS